MKVKIFYSESKNKKTGNITYKWGCIHLEGQNAKGLFTITEQEKAPVLNEYVQWNGEQYLIVSVKTTTSVAKVKKSLTFEGPESITGYNKLKIA